MSYFANPYAANQGFRPAYSVSVRFPGGARERGVAGYSGETPEEVAIQMSQITHGGREIIRVTERGTRRMLGEWRVIRAGEVERVR